MKWQPIETAPMEGSIIITDGETVEGAERGWYGWVSSSGQALVWEGSDERGGLREVGFKPLFWRPWPKPPSPKHDHDDSVDGDA